ncbi:unnamed protein product, partial [Effrenium voratum]
SMIIPLSLDFAASLNEGATASGFFLSAGVIASVIAMSAGKYLVDERKWDQFYVRRLMIFCPMVSLKLSFLTAVFINKTAAQGADNNFVWWSVILLGQASAFFQALPTIPGALFWSKITVPSRMTFWMILTQCSRNLGFVIGPMIFMVLNLSLHSTDPRVSPRSMMAWVQMIVFILSLCSAAFSALIMPVSLRTTEDAPTERIDASEDSPEETVDALEDSPEDLPDQDREYVVKNMILYSFERPFTLAAVEVCTVMMLELNYGWDPYYSGIVFTVVCSFGILATVVVTIFIQTKCVTESAAFMVAASLPLVSCMFLFDTGHSRAWTLLVADAGIYTGATVANGIAEGWASRAAKEGTSFSQGEYRLRNFLAVILSRFLGPIVGRLAVDFGGRNVYASLQFILCLLGTRTVYKVCRLLWLPVKGGRREGRVPVDGFISSPTVPEEITAAPPAPG